MTSQPEWPTGGGACGELLRHFDWSTSELGPPSTWPHYLRACVDTLLRAPVGMALLWGDRGVIIYNDAYSRVAAKKHPSLFALPVAEGWPEVADFVRDVTAQVREGTAVSLREQLLVLQRNGVDENVWFDLDFSEVVDEHGDFAGVLAVVMEITEKVELAGKLKAEQEASLSLNLRLAEESADLRQLFQESPGFMCVLRGPSHIFELVNASYLRLIGQRNVIGMGVREAIPEAEGQGYFELLDRVFQTGQPYVGKNWKIDLEDMETGQMRTRLLDFVYQPIRGRDGGISGIFVEGSDVTERANAEEQLRLSEERLQFALEAGGGVGIWHWDLASNLIYADKYFANVFSVDPDAAAAGAPVEMYMEGMHPDDRRRVGEHIAEVLSKGGDFTDEYRVIGADGAIRWVWVRGRCYLDAGGKDGRFPGVVTDTTRYRTAIEALELADQRKNEFLAMLGHELRNPLSPIVTAAKILENAEKIGFEAIERSREVIERQARHLNAIVDELLDVARITSGKITLKKDHVEIGEAIKRAAEQVGEMMKASRHAFNITGQGRPCYVVGDLNRITQIFANLLSNASKYTEPGGAITLTVDAEQNGVWVHIKDSGMGISPDILPHVFELFIQSRRALDRSQGGLGVGLTVVRRLVELHGGSIAAKSDGPGLGSEFSVWLPRAPEESTTSDKDGGAGKDTRPESRRIMVVDDNRDAAEMLSSVLEMQGHAVTTVYNGSEVLARAMDFRPDIILLDIGLPGLSGYEVADRVRSSVELRAVTLIALTGYGLDEDRRLSHAHGFDHHLVKPVNFEALAHIINATRLPSSVRGA